MSGTLEKIFQDKGYTVSIIPLTNAAMVSCILGNPMSILTAGCGNAEFVKQYSEIYASSAKAQNFDMKIKGNWFYYGTHDAIALFESIDINKEYQYMSDNHFEKNDDSDNEIEKNEIVNKVFGEVTFDVGWKVKEPISITLWGKVYSVRVEAEAYYETDKITEEQENAYKTFKSVLSEKQKATEKLLSKMFDGANPEQLSEQLTPTILIINGEGECALLFDDEEDEDNGLAVILLPEEDVQTQDQYL